MARASKRLEVLEAIVSIIERDGLTAVTLDAVALETGMTRAGLLYHFPSREALILATHEHLTRSWEQELEASAGNTSGAPQGLSYGQRQSEQMVNKGLSVAAKYIKFRGFVRLDELEVTGSPLVMFHPRSS